LAVARRPANRSGGPPAELARHHARADLRPDGRTSRRAGLGLIDHAMAEEQPQAAGAAPGAEDLVGDEDEEEFEELEPDLKGLVEYVARALVDKPTAVKVDEVQDGNTTVYELEVDEEDIGKVIGRQGRVVRGLRALVKAAATRKGTRVDLDVV
jgi:predicted RNA-binding protein YlqC (UPF0109 family)